MDPRNIQNKPARTLTYYADGRLETDKDALYTTSYEYFLASRTTKTTYPDTGVRTEVFDAQGMLLSETDPMGNTTTHEYDADLNEVKVTNALSEITTATYEHGNQTSRTNLVGTTHTTYNAFSQPTTFTDALGHVTTIEYDERGVPARFIDELGTRFSFTSSEQGVPLTIDDAEGKRAFLTYDDAGNVTSRTDWLGRVTRATYDEIGRKLTETTARGGVRTYEYTARGKVKKITDSKLDANGHVVPDPATEHYFDYDANDNVIKDYMPNAGRSTQYTYDELNRVKTIKYGDDTASDDDNPTVTYSYDFRGNKTQEKDELLHPTDYHYDLNGRLDKTTFADTKFTKRDYDVLNRLKALTDERNHTTTYGYEPGCGCSERLTTVTDPLLRVTTTGYDAKGRRSFVRDAADHTTSFVYDVRDQLLETRYPDTKTVVDVYDPRGRRISTTDQMIKTTLYGYDDQGQLTSVTDPLNHVTSYTYDLDGNLASVKDANNHETRYEYDLQKRKTKRTLPLLQFETFAYDPMGNQTAHTDFRGKTTTMTYDRRDRLKTKVPDPSLAEHDVTFTYFDTGMRKTMSDASGDTTYAYDERNRLKTKITPAGTLTYTYDAAGNLETIQSSNDNGTSVNYHWDDANQLDTVTDNRAGGVTTSAYTLTGRPDMLHQPNGVHVTYSYNDLNQITSMFWQHDGSPPFASWEYSYNKRGQRLSSKDIIERVAAYGYDDAARLISETISKKTNGIETSDAITYVLDNAGNRVSRTSAIAAVPSATYSYDANDQLTSDGYDPNGNTTSSEGDTYAYDFENRLVSKNGGAVTIVYDGDGNRVAKTVGGVTTRYLVDDQNPTGYLQVLEEVSGGAAQIGYTHGTRPISQTRGLSSVPATNYYGYDAHGNITFLTDAVGTVTDSYDYDAWGILVASTGTTPNSRRYAGEEFDQDLGLINLRARQYRAGSARFLTIDPLDVVPTGERPPGARVGELASHIEHPHIQPIIDMLTVRASASARVFTALALNRFLYANGDPIDLSDPTGLATAVEESTTNAAVAANLQRARILFVVGKKLRCPMELIVNTLVCIELGKTQPELLMGCLERARLKSIACMSMNL